MKFYNQVEFIEYLTGYYRFTKFGAERLSEVVWDSKKGSAKYDTIDIAWGSVKNTSYRIVVFRPVLLEYK